MTRTRAERIARNENKKKRVYHILHAVFYDGDLRRGRMDINEIWQRARKYRDNLKMCSCPICGHKRYAIGETVQEKRIAEYEKQAIGDEV
jgi:hypothetical protein